jgi:hypothetical protein
MSEQKPATPSLGDPEFEKKLGDILNSESTAGTSPAMKFGPATPRPPRQPPPPQPPLRKRIKEFRADWGVVLRVAAFFAMVLVTIYILGKFGQHF